MTSAPSLAWVRSLRDRSVREATGFFLAEGTRFALVAESVNAIEALVLAPMTRRTREIAERAERARVPIIHATAAEFRSLSLLDEPQGIAVVSRVAWSPLPAFGSKPSLWLAFDEVRSPGNLGSVLRTAAGAGATGAIFLSGGADPFDPRALRASMGAIHRLRLVRATSLALARAARGRAILVGTSAHGAVDYGKVDYRDHTVLLIGAERGGMSEAQWRLADVCARIPVRPEIGSLNLSAASSVLLYEAVRQRSAPRHGSPRRARGGRRA